LPERGERSIRREGKRGNRQRRVGREGINQISKRINLPFQQKKEDSIRILRKARRHRKHSAESGTIKGGLGAPEVLGQNGLSRGRLKCREK